MSTVGKVYECIADTRLCAWLVDQEILNAFQYAYIKDRYITQALLYFTLNATRGLKQGMHVLRCFIDLEGAFDLVRRAGICYMLYEAGLWGNLFLYIASYLENREV